MQGVSGGYNSPMSRKISWQDRLVAAADQALRTLTDPPEAARPSPAEGLKQFVAAMLEHGVSETEIARMISVNPKSLLGIA